MPTDATVKDVLYALQFGKQHLCRRPANRAGTPNAWSLHPSGLRVPARVADEARQRREIIPVVGGLAGEDHFGWSDAA